MRSACAVALLLLGAASAWAGAPASSAADGQLERWRKARTLEERLLIVGDLGVTPGSTDALARVLSEDPDEAVRLRAVTLLAALRTDAAVRALLGAITRPDPFVTDAAIRALREEQVPASTRAWLVGEALRDASAPDRQALVAGLVGALGCADALPVLRRLAGSQSWRVRAAVAGALGALDAPASRSELRRLAGDEQLRVRVAALEALAGAPDDGSTKVLRKAARTDSAWQARVVALRLLAPREADRATARALVGDMDSPWQVRAAAIEALAGWRSPLGVEALVEALPRSEREPARLRAELTAALTGLTGQTLAGRDAWRGWWRGVKASYELPAVEAVATVGQTRVRFYGLPIESDAPCFVIDVSGSMGEPAAVASSGVTTVVAGERAHASGEAGGPTKLQVARKELAAALEALPPGASFGLLLFNDGLLPVAQAPVPATRENVASALAQLDAYAPGGSTDLYAALEAVFHGSEPGDPDAAARVRFDTLVLLTDGLPTRGTVTDPAELLRRVRSWNRYASLRIHTVGLGEQDTTLLQALARDSGGKYVAR